jgi:hypothetical protein
MKLRGLQVRFRHGSRNNPAGNPAASEAPGQHCICERASVARPESSENDESAPVLPGHFPYSQVSHRFPTAFSGFFGFLWDLPVFILDNYGSLPQTQNRNNTGVTLWPP